MGVHVLTTYPSGFDDANASTLKEEARFMHRQIGAESTVEVVIMHGMTIYRAAPRNEHELARAVSRFHGA